MEKETFPEDDLRAQFGTRFPLKVTDRQASEMILGAGTLSHGVMASFDRLRAAIVLVFRSRLSHVERLRREMREERRCPARSRDPSRPAARHPHGHVPLPPGQRNRPGTRDGRTEGGGSTR